MRNGVVSLMRSRKWLDNLEALHADTVVGIANQLAFDAQLSGVQEVKSVSFRHQKRYIANARW